MACVTRVMKNVLCNKKVLLNVDVFVAEGTLKEGL